MLSKFAPHAGGTAVVWTNWCSHWPAAQLTVIAPYVSGCEEFDRLQAYRVIRVKYPDIPKLRMIWLWLALAFKAWFECWKRPPRFIHFGHAFETGFWAPLLKRFTSIPFAIHTYGEELVYAARFPLLRKIVSAALADAVLVTVISDYTSNLLSKFQYYGPRLLVYPGVDGGIFRPDLANSHLGEDLSGPILLTVGRLMERKGHLRVIRQIPRLLKQFPGLNYLIAGIGPYEQVLKSEASSLGIESQVRFLGKVPDAELPSLYGACDAFVHPNYTTETGDVEGFGIAFLEAQACGIPVVGGNSGGTPDAVSDGVGGFLVSEDNEELYSVLERLLSDKRLATAMGLSARRWATSKSFCWGHSAQMVWRASHEVQQVKETGF